jgi:hypothetical protein
MPGRVQWGSDFLGSRNEMLDGSMGHERWGKLLLLEGILREDCGALYALAMDPLDHLERTRDHGHALRFWGRSIRCDERISSELRECFWSSRLGAGWGGRRRTW